MRQPVSVVVPTRDRPVLLDECLRSIEGALRPGDQLIVADSASNDPAVRDVALSHNAVYVRCDRPGVSLARNAGWQRACHEIVAFTDDDVRTPPDWLDRVVDALGVESPTAPTFITGRVEVPPEQGVVDRAVAITTDLEPATIDTAGDGPVGQSANMAIRRAAIAAVGGFDEFLGPGSPRNAAAEDLDLYDRLIAAGLGGRYEPSVSVWHVQWRDRRQLVVVDWRYGRGSGLRVAKLLRTDRHRARRVARRVFVHWGLGGIVQSIRQRYKSGVVFALARLSGALLGLVEGLFVPVRDGHFAPRRR